MQIVMNLGILATVPRSFLYVNPIKIAVVIVLLILWATALQWVDRDTDVVKTKRHQWNLIVMSGGFVGFFVLFAVPWPGALFFVGIAFWALMAGGALVFYVIHRNGRVIPARRVLTLQHFKQLIVRGDGEKRLKNDKGLRVRIENHTGAFVERSNDPAQAGEFEAAQDFLYNALWRRASDVDLITGKDKYRLILHIDGVPSEQSDGMVPEDADKIIRFLKRAAGLNTEEIRRPQRGKITVALLSQTGAPGKTDVQTSGTTAGERLHLHIQSGPALMRINELGIAPGRMEGLRAILGQPKGLFIISGPQHSGATTTEYAVLRSHDAYMHNIYALERHAMIDLDNVTQHLYDGANTDVNYARVLQTVLRREPDIVLVADCDDRETCLLSAKAAAEDRKIYLGMAATDSFDALAKLMKFVEDGALAGQALLGISNQRLIRKLCPDCREAYRPDPATLTKLNLPLDKIERFYRPPSEPKVDKRGREIPCPTCQGTGYVGRTGIFEVLLVDDAVRQLIRQGAPLKAIKGQCRKNKMYYLQEEGLLKVIDGTTSMNEILRVLRNGES